MNYFEFQGQKYYPGTKVRMKDRTLGGTFIATFKSRNIYSDREDELCFYHKYLFINSVDYLQSSILEIVEIPNTTEGIYCTNRRCPSDWQVEMGITWYIIIMIACSLLQARWLAWIFVTGYFLLWRNGFMNGGKK